MGIKRCVVWIVMVLMCNHIAPSALYQKMISKEDSLRLYIGLTQMATVQQLGICALLRSADKVKFE